MVERAKNNGTRTEELLRLNDMVQNHLDIFRGLFSAGPGAKVRQLKIDLTSESMDVPVRLRKYSQEKRKLLSEIVSSVLDAK